MAAAVVGTYLLAVRATGSKQWNESTANANVLRDVVVAHPRIQQLLEYWVDPRTANLPIRQADLLSCAAQRRYLGRYDKGMRASLNKN